MALKVSAIALVVFCITAQVLWESHASIVKRDTAPQNKNATQMIDDTIQSFKAGFDELAQKIGENELIRNMSQTFQEWTKAAEQQSKQFFDQLNTKPKN